MTRFATITKSTRVVKETWDSTKVAEPINPRSRRTRANAPAYNEVFKYMAQVIDDEFWKERFTEAVTGVFPPKITYCNGVMQYRGVEDATIMLQTEVDEGDVETLATQSITVIHFYQTYIQMYSPTDVQQMNEPIAAELLTDEDMGCVWNKIKQKQQDLALYELIREEKVRRGLTREQVLQLEQTINICKQLKYTNATTIRVSRFRIISQTFLKYDEAKKVYYIDPSLVVPIRMRVEKKKPVNPKPSYFDKWSSFHDGFARDGVSTDNIRNFRHPSGDGSNAQEDGTETTLTNVTTT